MGHDIPTVSVAIAAYNAAAQLREALRSALNQTSAPLEVIVVDDGSTDDTRAVCESFGARIRYIHQSNDGTMGAGARLRAMREAQGDWIAILDHDDLWHPDKLRQQLAAIEQHPDAFAVYTGHTVFGVGARPEEPLATAVRVERMDARDAYHFLLRKSAYYASSALVRREFVLNHGLPDPAIMGCADWDLALAVARRYPIVVVNEPLTLYRVSSAQYSADFGRLAGALMRSLEAQVPHLHGECAACRQSLTLGRAYANQIHGIASRTFLDRYHGAVQDGELRAAAAFLRGALTNSPREVIRPRRLAAVVKNGLRGIARAGWRRLRPSSPH